MEVATTETQSPIGGAPPQAVPRFDSPFLWNQTQRMTLYSRLSAAYIGRILNYRNMNEGADYLITQKDDPAMERTANGTQRPQKHDVLARLASQLLTGIFTTFTTFYRI